MTKIWTVHFLESALKDLKTLDVIERRRIMKYIEDIVHGPGPRCFGKPLKGKLHTFWRYRVGHYRILCTLNDDSVTILVVHVAHRSRIYDRA